MGFYLFVELEELIWSAENKFEGRLGFEQLQDIRVTH